MPRSGRPSGVGRSIGHLHNHSARRFHRPFRPTRQITITFPINSSTGTERLFEILQPPFEDGDEPFIKQTLNQKLAAIRALGKKGFNITNEDKLLSLLKSEDTFPIFEKNNNFFRVENVMVKSELALMLQKHGNKKDELVSILEEILSKAENDSFFLTKTPVNDPSETKIHFRLTEPYCKFVVAYSNLCRTVKKETSSFIKLMMRTINATFTNKKVP